MKSLTIIILSSLAFTACSSTRQIHSDDPRSLSSIASKHNQQVRITLHSGEQHAGTQLEMQPDSTRWQDRQRGVQRTVRTADIAQVTHISRGRSALLGAGLGFTGGLLIASAIPVSDGCKNGSNSFGECLGDGIGRVMLGGLIGVMTGVAVGSSIGTKKHFVLRESGEFGTCAAPGCTLSHEQTRIFYRCTSCKRVIGTEHVSHGERCPSCKRGFVR